MQRDRLSVWLLSLWPADQSQPGATPSLVVDPSLRPLEEAVAQQPQDTRPYVALAQAYLQKVRETADTAYYGPIEELMQQAETIDKNDPEIVATKAAMAYGRHDFQKGFELAESLVAAHPHKAAYWGLLADAQTELGRYEEAAQSLQTMVDLRPDFNSFTRVAYIRELHGDIPGAKAALTSALSAGSAVAEHMAWAEVELGKLFFRSDPTQARPHFEYALQLLPEYAPAHKWLGMVSWANNNLPEAQQRLQKAATILPIAEYATDLGDIFWLQNDQARAQQQYTLARLAYTTSAASGVNTDLEESVFLSERDLDKAAALAKAERSFTVRPTVFGADALAWAWYKHHDLDKAQHYSKEALRLGEHDATILFHAGMIAKERGENVQARAYLGQALSLHPYFSLRNRQPAQEALNSLAGTP